MAAVKGHEARAGAARQATSPRSAYQLASANGSPRRAHDPARPGAFKLAN